MSEKIAVELQLGKEVLDRAIEDRLSAVLADKGKEGFQKFVQNSSQREKMDVAYRVWRNNGFVSTQDALMFDTGEKREKAKIGYSMLVDTLHTKDAPILLPKVVTQIVREAYEPVLSLTPLFRTIRFSGPSISFPATGAMIAGDVEEGGEYPDRKMDIGYGTVVATIGKSGIKCRITEEMLRYSQYDVMSMHLEAAGRALARHKEVKASNQISTNATVTYDNDGGASGRGSTIGRDIHGTGNNTLTLDDLLLMYADMINDGFLPGLLIMNPMGWLIFARDPTLRAFGFQHGGSLWGQFPPEGQAFNTSAFSAGPNLSVPFATQRNRNTTASAVPNLFPAPLRIVVSPFVSFNATTQKTDIYMADPNEVGVLVVDEEVTSDQWTDPNTDIRAVKFRERYAFQVLDEGKGLRVAKNVSTKRGYDYEDRLIWDQATASIPTISQQDT